MDAWDDQDKVRNKCFEIIIGVLIVCMMAKRNL